MAKRIVSIVRTCKGCPYVTNNIWEHNDPFSPTPSTTYWYCEHPDRKSPMGNNYITGEGIDKYCPLDDTNA